MKTFACENGKFHIGKRFGQGSMWIHNQRTKTIDTFLSGMLIVAASCVLV